MTRQVMKIELFGRRYSVTFTEGTNRNPFTLYEITTAPGRYGYPTDRRRTLARYQNFESCLYHLQEIRPEEFRRDYFPG